MTSVGAASLGDGGSCTQEPYSLVGVIRGTQIIPAIEEVLEKTMPISAISATNTPAQAMGFYQPVIVIFIEQLPFSYWSHLVQTNKSVHGTSAQACTVSCFLPFPSPQSSLEALLNK